MNVEISICLFLLVIWLATLSIQILLKRILRVLTQILEKTEYNQQVIDSNEKALNVLLTEYISKGVKKNE